MNRKISILLFLLCICLSISCTFPSLNNEMGNLEISTYGWAPWVVNSKEPTKAWMIANSVRIDFYQNSTITKTVSITPSNTFNTSSPSLQQTVQNVPVGNYSKCVVSIFNNSISTSSPVVIGTSGSFSVTSGNVTSLSITCFPTSTVNISENTFTSVFSLNKYGEKWFYVASPYNSTKFYIKSVTGDMDVYIFKPDGVYLGCMTGTSNEEVITLSTPSNPYYVCMYAYAAGSGQVKFSQ